MRPIAVGLTIQAGTAAIAADSSQPQPYPGDFFGYGFEWGPMIAGLLACLAVRFYVSKTEEEHRWTVDMPISALALFFTAAFIQSTRPIPLMALLYGTGCGAFGVGFIRLALSFVRKNLDVFGNGDDEDDKPKP